MLLLDTSNNFAEMAWNSPKRVNFKCNGRKAQIMNHVWPGSRENPSPSFVKSDTTNLVTPEESKSCLNENSRGLVRISATGFAHCRRGITNLGFTNEECEFIASRQRAANYLFYLYNDRGQPVSTNETRKSSRYLKSSPESSWRVKSAPVETVTKVLIGDKRVCSSALPRGKARVGKEASFCSASFAQRLNQTTIDESPGTIIVRSMNQHLSPSERLERYLISLQREGYLTSARKDRRKNFDTQLGTELTQKGAMSLRSKFLPHPPVYLFQKGQ